MPRVVIVGGGFGGLYAASYLARSELAERGASITLVDRKNHFTFTPLLAEVAAGTFGREHVTHPYRVLGRRYGFHFVQDSVRQVDFSESRVKSNRAAIPFDYLVLAVGAEPRYFGNDRLRAQSFPLTSVDDALAIRDRVIGALELATTAVGTQDRERALSFVVAGAGPAGVEIASEINHLANNVLRPFYPDLPRARVLVADGGDRILHGWDQALARAGLSRLRDRGVEVRLHTRIRDATDCDVVLENATGHESIPVHTLIWTAGTTPRSIATDRQIPMDRGAIRVSNTLQVVGLEHVFAVGDVTAALDHTGSPYPRVAPIAISQGIRAAANIENLALGRPPEPYEAHHAGKIVSLGSGVALVDLLGIPLTGVLAWWIYRSAYLLKLVGGKNKARVLVTLALNKVFGPDITSETPISRREPPCGDAPLLPPG